MKVSRKCPNCDSDVKVLKTITGLNTPHLTEKLQKLSCTGCGATAFATVSVKVEWHRLH